MLSYLGFALLKLTWLVLIIFDFTTILLPGADTKPLILNFSLLNGPLFPPIEILF